MFIDIEEAMLNMFEKLFVTKSIFLSYKKYCNNPPSVRITKQQKFDMSLLQKTCLWEMWEFFQIISSGSGALYITTCLPLTRNPLYLRQRLQKKFFTESQKLGEAVNQFLDDCLEKTIIANF